MENSASMNSNMPKPMTNGRDPAQLSAKVSAYSIKSSSD